MEKAGLFHLPEFFLVEKLIDLTIFKIVIKVLATLN